MRTALHCVAIALIGFYLLTVLVRNVSLQWDFKCYLLASRAAWAGLDPYQLPSLAAMTHNPVLMPFVYPPIALMLFLGLAAIPASIAAWIWIGTKAAILTCLVFAWSRWFAPRSGMLAIALVAVFGWNAAALWDLRSGNVALIECALLWSAFGCFISGRLTAFSVLVVVASTFKLMPAAYMFLLLVPTNRHGPSPIRLLVSLAALAALVWLPFAVGPAASWRGFMRNVPSPLGLGDANPSAFALAGVLAEYLGVKGAGLFSWTIGLWAAYAFTLLALSAPFFKVTWRMREPMRWVMAAVVLDLLITPRPMAYGFVRLGPALLFFASELLQRPGWSLLLALMLSAQGLVRCANHQIDSTLMFFLPFLLTLGLWLAIVRGVPRTTLELSARGV